MPTYAYFDEKSGTILNFIDTERYDYPKMDGRQLLKISRKTHDECKEDFSRYIVSPADIKDGKVIKTEDITNDN